MSTKDKMREFTLTESITLTLKEDETSSGRSTIGFYLNETLIEEDFLEKGSFDKYCDKMAIWLDKDYDMSIISDTDGDVFFHILFKLCQMNEPKARQFYKVQVGNIIKNAEYSDYLYKNVIDEGYLSELSLIRKDERLSKNYYY